MSTYKKYFNNAYMYKHYTNSSSDMFNYTMSNLMDNFYDSAMSTAIDGKFKAVCLSGIRTEDNDSGFQSTEPGSTDTSAEIAEDPSLGVNFIKIIVRPLTQFGDILPNPTSMTSAESINQAIQLHATTFVARSDYSADSVNSPQYGQIIDCYFEKGSVINSNFETLRFSEPRGLIFDNSFLRLATIEGVQTASGAFNDGSPGLLGTPPSYEELGADHLGAAESGFADSKFGPGQDGILRKRAWEALRPFLTKKTVLTSVYRGQDDQNRIIKNYATRYGFQGDTSDYDAMHAFIRSKPTPGLIVARRVGRGHGGVGRTGAFDLSGDNLDLIWQSVEAANAELSGKVKFAKLKQSKGYSSIIERGNNCVHVHFELSDINL